ncbi:hypothetical protein B0H10DRAFT_1965602 [Mycena sp. CBHHK59/15]|nr:hypothetical protein B0H10DRAFT_1965602 [Mycena sp. CBHHK59/15]
MASAQGMTQQRRERCTRLYVPWAMTMLLQERICLPYGAVITAAATAMDTTKKAVLSVPLISSLEDRIQAYLVTARYLSQKAEARASCMGLPNKSKSISSDTVWDNCYMLGPGSLDTEVREAGMVGVHNTTESVRLSTIRVHRPMNRSPRTTRVRVKTRRPANTVGDEEL